MSYYFCCALFNYKDCDPVGGLLRENEVAAKIILNVMIFHFSSNFVDVLESTFVDFLCLQRPLTVELRKSF